MMSDRSSMRMQSTSCCFDSLDMGTLELYLAAPQFPGAHAGGLVDRVGEPPLLLVERRDRRAALEPGGPVLDAGVDLGVDGAEHRRLKRRPAGHAAVRAHE